MARPGQGESLGRLKIGQLDPEGVGTATWQPSHYNIWQKEHSISISVGFSYFHIGAVILLHQTGLFCL